MNTSRLIDTPLDSSRQAYIQSKFDQIKPSCGGSVPSDSAIAYTAGFIAVNEDRPIVAKYVESKLETSYVYAVRAVRGLYRAGFITKELDRSQTRFSGRPPELLIPKTELYEAISMVPAWQSATRVCILATELDLTISQAIDAAVTTNLDLLDLNHHPIDP